MPNRPPRDPSAEIEAILREATARILAVLDEEQRRTLEALRGQLDGPGQEPGPAATGSGGPSGSPARGRRVRTEDVVETLREVFRQHREGLRIAELRAETGFADMQLHRALQLLVEAGEVRKAGPPRKTRFQLVPSRGRGARRTGERGRAPAPSAPARRPPRDQWVSTPEVIAAVERALRGRRQGLRMAELCETTGFTDKQLHRALRALDEEGRLRKTGAHRAMRYQLRR